MNFIGMPYAMWIVFGKSFKENLVHVLKMSKTDAQMTMTMAKKKYKEIIGNLPEFEKGDRFQMNIISCAMFSAIILSMPEKPDVEKLTIYYRKSMMTKVMKWFCRKSGKRKFTRQDIENMKKTAALKAADRNPYSWNMEYLPYLDESGYEARFTKCGICTLMKELGLWEYVPCMCTLDYTMSEAGGASKFVREWTLANGDAYCDCGYKKRMDNKDGIYRIWKRKW